MPEDEITIQHGLPGRAESPALERTARLAVEKALSDLVSSKLLYQKVVIDLSHLEAELEATRAKASRELLTSLQQEVEVRPWELNTHHQGDNPLHRSIFAAARAGGQPVGTPIREMHIHFYAPAVQLQCPVCKGDRTFVALQSSRQFNLEPPYPDKSERGLTEQVYTIYYRCEGCRKFIYATLIRREGLQLHLCGFAPRRSRRDARQVPKALRPILNDATDAVAEGDLYAGFYHLRTMIEHFAKIRLKKPLESRERGEDLLTAYYATLAPNIKSVLPSLTVSYEALSQNLHARIGSVDDFYTQLSAVCDHIEALASLSKYAPREA
jgi:hypothetical protein